MSCPVCPTCHEQRTRFTKCAVNGRGSKQYAKDTKHISVAEWDFIRSFGSEMFKNYLLTKHLKKVTACTSKLFQWLHPRGIDECALEGNGKQASKKVAQKSAAKKTVHGTKLTSGKSPCGQKPTMMPIASKAATARATSSSKSTPAKASAQLTFVKRTPSIPFIHKFDFLDKFEFLHNAGAGSWFGGGGGELLFPTVVAQEPVARAERPEETDSPYRDSFSGMGEVLPGHADWLGQELCRKFGRESRAVEFDFLTSPTAEFSRRTYETFEPSRTFGARDDDFRLKTFPERELHRIFGRDARPEAYGALDYYAGQNDGFGFPEDFTHMDFGYTMRTGARKQRTAPEGAAGQRDCAAGEAGCVAGAQYLDVLPQGKRVDTPIWLDNTEVINYLQNSRLPRQGKHIGTVLAAALKEAPKLVDSNQFAGLRFGPKVTGAPTYLDYARAARQVNNFGPRRMEASRFYTTRVAPQQRNVSRTSFGPAHLEISKYFTQTGMPRTGHLQRSDVEPRTVDTAYTRTRNLEALKHLAPTVHLREGALAPAALGAANIGVIKSLTQARALSPQRTIAPFALSSKNIEDVKTLVKTGDPRLGNYYRAALGPRNIAALKYLVQTGQLRQGNNAGVDRGGQPAYSRRFDSSAKEDITDVVSRSAQEADLEYTDRHEYANTITEPAGVKKKEAFKNLQRTIAPAHASTGLEYGGDGDYTRTRQRRPSPVRVPFTYTKSVGYAGMQHEELPGNTRVFHRQQPAEDAQHLRASISPRNTRAFRQRLPPDYRHQEASTQQQRTLSTQYANIIGRGAGAERFGEPRNVRHQTGSPQRGPFTYTRLPAYVGQQPHRELQQKLAAGPPVRAENKVPRGYEYIRIPRFSKYQQRRSPPSMTGTDVGPRKTFRDLTPTGSGRKISPSTRKYQYAQYIRDTDYAGRQKTKSYRVVQSPFKTTKFARYMDQHVEPSNIPSKASQQGTGPLGAPPKRVGPYGTTTYGTGPYGFSRYGSGPYTTGRYGSTLYGTAPFDLAKFGAAFRNRRSTRAQYFKHKVSSKDVILPPMERNYIADAGYTGHKYSPIVNYFGSMNYGVNDLYRHERALREMERQRQREKERLASFAESLNLFYNIINKPDLQAEFSSDEDELSLNYRNEQNERGKAEQKKLNLLDIVELLRSENKTKFHPVVYHEPFSKSKPWTWMQNFPTKIPTEYLRQLSMNTLTTLKAWQRQQALMVEKARDDKNNRK